MIAVPLLAALLTGCRDMDVFGKTDWGIFTGMACLEVVIAILTFRAANRGGKLLLSAEYLEDRLRIAVILSHPLPTNHAIADYIGGDHTGRAVVCGFPRAKAYTTVSRSLEKISGWRPPIHPKSMPIWKRFRRTVFPIFWTLPPMFLPIFRPPILQQLNA